MNAAVVGGGVMGLSVALALLRNGHDVTVYEADNRLGGMSATFDFGGLSIERFYHFICTGDQPLFALLDELELMPELRWRETRMGYFHSGALHDWGNPVALMKFPGLDPVSRIRTGLHTFLATRRTDWHALDRQTAVDWLKRGIGEKAYTVLWKNLFELKFHQYTDELSAAWIWSRIRRIGRSRKNIFVERLGYLQGGSETLIGALAERIVARGGRICLRTPVTGIKIQDRKVQGIECSEERFAHDLVVSTIPLPLVPEAFPELPADLLARYRAVKNVGVVCVLVKTASPVTENFWLNISDPRIEAPGLIEYTNLNPQVGHVSYLPFYLPHDHPDYVESDAFFIDRSASYLKLINPAVETREFAVQRYPYAQPICPPRFFETLPPIRTAVENLYIADTSHYYPEDRSISESVLLGRKISDMVGESEQ